MCIGASLVGGELDQDAAVTPRFIDGPLKHRGSKTPASMARGDPYGIGLRSIRATSCQAWDERQLHGREHVNTVGCDDEQLCRVGVDRGECPLIRSEAVRCSDCFASPAERVVGE